MNKIIIKMNNCVSEQKIFYSNFNKILQQNKHPLGIIKKRDLS